ncbi:MAG: hypothetical protein WCK78_19420 [Paludibacter sp.]
MKASYLFILMLICIFYNYNNSCAQTHIPMSCGCIDCNSKNTKVSNGSQKSTNILSSKDKYYDFYNSSLAMWIPNSNDGVKTIKINFIIVQKDANDPQNFSLNGHRSDGKSDDSFLRDLVVSVNNIYANLADPSDNAAQAVCGTCNQVKNSKVQFSLEGIHYIVDSNVWGTTDESTYNYNPSSEINIYLPRTSLAYSWCRGYSTTNLNGNIDLVMNNYYNVYLAFVFDDLVTLLGHELGHALGLCHTYLNGGCSSSKEDMLNSGGFFDDHFGTYPGRCPDKICPWNANPYVSNSDSITNNIMGNTVYRHYWTPKQMGAIQRNMVFNNTRKYLKNSVRNSNPIIVNSNELWDFDMLLDRDIQINNLGIITLSQNLQMPDNALITINSGGQLIVNNSTIKNGFNNDWNGITVKSGGLLVLNGTTISDYNITVEAGGSLIIKGSLVMSGNHAITVQSGGYLCVETGTTVQLTDYNSVIKIGESSLNGVNPALSISSSCISNPSAIIPSGNGAIADFNQDMYIQNLTISASRYFGGKNIYVGNHVTTGQTAGDVKINNGANVIFDCKATTFDAGFECVLGSSYEVKNH